LCSAFDGFEISAFFILHSTASMTIEQWLEISVADAKARGLDGTVPVLEALARAMHVLRNAPWNVEAVARDAMPEKRQ
jgi:hypothetical protein